MSSANRLRSNLANAKNHGSAKEGVSHWFLQRVTAIIIAPTAVWFLYNILTLFSKAGVGDVAVWFASPVNLIISVLMFGALFLHAALGLQVAIEDYIHAKKLKYFTLLKVKIGYMLLSIIAIISMLKLHFSSVSGIGF